MNTRYELYEITEGGLEMYRGQRATLEEAEAVKARKQAEGYNVKVVEFNPRTWGQHALVTPLGKPTDLRTRAERLDDAIRAEAERRKAWGI